MNNIVNIIINTLRLHRHHHQNYHYFYHQYNLHILVYLFIYFVEECQEIRFEISCYTFSKWGRSWWRNRKACEYQGGYLVSIETDEEWQFINEEIQKRSSWNTSAWHIGLRKKNKTWTWESGEKLNISRWRNSEKKGRAEISKNESLFNKISWYEINAFICEMPEGR